MKSYEAPIGRARMVKRESTYILRVCGTPTSETAEATPEATPAKRPASAVKPKLG